MIAGMMQKVNPFKSSQPKVRVVILMMTPDGCLGEEKKKILLTFMRCLWSLQDTQPSDSDLSSSDGSLADNNNLPEKQVDLCNHVSIKIQATLGVFAKLTHNSVASVTIYLCLVL